MTSSALVGSSSLEATVEISSYSFVLPSGVNPDDQGMRSYTYSFSWLAPRKAMSGLLVARGLGGHEACGTFGVQVATVNADGEIVEEHDVCRNGRILRG